MHLKACKVMARCGVCFVKQELWFIEARVRVLMGSGLLLWSSAVVHLGVF